MVATPKPSPRKKVKKKKLITLSKLKKKVQEVVNLYVRTRDSKDGFFTCISCGETKPVSQLQAGHFVPVSKSQFLRFHDWNINGECVRCNCFSEYHLIPYRRNLIDKIGIEAVKWLESKAEEVKSYKHTRQELTDLENYYKQLLESQ